MIALLKVLKEVRNKNYTQVGTEQNTFFIIKIIIIIIVIILIGSKVFLIY